MSMLPRNFVQRKMVPCQRKDMNFLEDLKLLSVWGEQKNFSVFIFMPDLAWY